MDEYGSVKTRILLYFMQCLSFLLSSSSSSESLETRIMDKTLGSQIQVIFENFQNNLPTEYANTHFQTDVNTNVNTHYLKSRGRF